MTMITKKNRSAALLTAALAVLQSACVASASKNQTPPHTLGESQSPVAIVTANLVQEERAGKPEFHYAATSFKAENNGHTVEFVPADTENYALIDGGRFTVQQAHLHAPSEHTVDAESFALELHIVHKSDSGGIAVVALMISAGAENEPFKEAFSRLPSAEGREVDLETPIDLSAFTADKTIWYRYTGSLTTPPYTEGVQWFIAAEPLEMSQDQINAFTALYPANNRPLQDLNSRLIFTAR